MKIRSAKNIGAADDRTLDVGLRQDATRPITCQFPSSPSWVRHLPVGAHSMSSEAATAMKTRLRADLRAAMAARQTSEVAVIRTLMAALDNAEAPPAAQQQPPGGAHDFLSGSAEVRRLELGAERIAEILLAEAEERETAATEMDRSGQPDAAARLRAEAAIARRYLTA